MSERIMCLSEGFIMLRGFQHKLVSVLSLSPPESSIAKKETPRAFNEFLALRRQQFMQSGWVAEKVMYALYIVIALRNVRAGRRGVGLELWCDVGLGGGWLGCCCELIQMCLPVLENLE